MSTVVESATTSSIPESTNTTKLAMNENGEPVAITSTTDNSTQQEGGGLIPAADQPRVFEMKDFDIKKLKINPKTAKGKIAYCEYDGEGLPLFQFTECFTNGFYKHDPTKSNKKGGNDKNQEGDNPNSGGNKDLKLILSLDPADDVGLANFQDNLPQFIFEDKELLDSMFGVQSAIKKEALKESVDSLTRSLNNFHKEGDERKDSKGLPIIDEKTGQPVRYQNSIFLTTKVNEKTGKPCCDIYSADRTLLYGHYDDEKKNEDHLAALQAQAKLHGVTTFQEQDPLELVKKCRVSVLAQLLGLYRAGKGYGPSFRVIQIVKAPPRQQATSIAPGTCILLPKSTK